MLTIWDTLIEHKTRPLSGFETVLHFMLLINYGIFLGLFFPILQGWAALPSGLVEVNYGLITWLFAAFAAGVAGLALRDLYAIMNLTIRKVPEWKRKPIRKGKPRIRRRILITGATGFIGTHLTRMFIERGHSVWVLTRDKAKAVYKFGPHIRALESADEIPDHIMFDSIINLAGARIVGPLWTKKRKKQLLDSRLKPTLAILNLIRRLEHKPDVLISASGDRLLPGAQRQGSNLRLMKPVKASWRGCARSGKAWRWRPGNTVCGLYRSGSAWRWGVKTVSCRRCC